MLSARELNCIPKLTHTQTGNIFSKEKLWPNSGGKEQLFLVALQGTVGYEVLNSFDGDCHGVKISKMHIQKCVVLKT